MTFDLRGRTLLLAVAGSRAYGIHTAASDVDVKGVAVPPARYYHGYLERFEQADKASEIQPFLQDLTPEEQAISREIKLEGSVYELRKFITLAAQANPNILDVLFCREAELRRVTPLGARLREARGLFLSAKARHTFSGYAMSQLKRIKLHRKWLLEPPAAPPTRAEYDLPEQTLIPADQLAAANAAVQKRMDQWEIDFGELEPAGVVAIQAQVERFLSEVLATTGSRWRSAARTIGLDENLIFVMQKEREYQAAQRYWKQYQDWKANRNPARAALEAAHGYDCKHGAHLYRLTRMCREILEDGEVNVWRGGIDAEEIRAIRAGEWEYDRLVEWAEAEDAALTALYREGRYVVPKRPDVAAIDALCCELVEAGLSD